MVSPGVTTQSEPGSQVDSFFVSPLPQAVFNSAWRLSGVNSAWMQSFPGIGSSWEKLIHPDDFAGELAAMGRLHSRLQRVHRTTLRLLEQQGGWQRRELVISTLEAQAGVTLVMVLPAAGAAVASSAGAGDGRMVAAGLSHDVRQQLRLISSYATLLARTPLAGRQLQHLTVITAGAVRLQDLIGRLAHWLRLAETVPSLTACDLTAVWKSATSDLDADIQCGDLPIVLGDVELLTELFHEVARNAVCYHPGRVQLVLSVDRSGQAVECRVSDDGPGIPLEQRQQVLLPLRRLHSWEAVPGHGMGLAIASRIAACHRGELSIDAAPSGGCAVKVRLLAAGEPSFTESAPLVCR